MEATIIEKSSHPYNDNYTSVQLMLPIDLQLIIPTTDPVYKFEMIMNKVNFHKYLVSTRTEKRGRRGYNPQTLLKIILFGFMLIKVLSADFLAVSCFANTKLKTIIPKIARYHISIGAYPKTINMPARMLKIILYKFLLRRDIMYMLVYTKIKIVSMLW